MDRLLANSIRLRKQSTKLVFYEYMKKIKDFLCDRKGSKMYEINHNIFPCN